MPVTARTRGSDDERQAGVEARAARVNAAAAFQPQPAPISQRLLFSLLLALIILYPVWFAIHYRGVYDPDVWWHLRTGQWILEHGSIPRVDLFSTLQGKPWAPYSWAFDAGLALLYSGLGYFGVFVLYPVGMVLALSALVVGMVRELELGPWASLGTTAAVLGAISPIFSPRPGLVTVLLFAAQLWILLRAMRTGGWRGLALLPVLYLLWANVHVQFIYGLLALGLFVLAPLARRLWPGFESGEQPAAGKRWAVLAACGLATLINPFGPRIYATIVGFATQLGQWQYLAELQSPSFRSLNSYVLLLWVLAAWMMVGWRRSLLRWQTVLLLAGSLMAFRQVRDIWFAALAGLCALSPAPEGERDEEQARLPAIVPWLTAVLVLLGTLAVAAMHPLSQAGLEADIADEFPVKAAAYVRQRHLQGAVYSDISWGGFLIWSLPEMRVSLDSRTNVHSDEQVERTMAVWSGVRDWASDPELLSALVVMANPSQPLTSLLRLDPRFRVSYEDGQAVVFEPVGRN